MGYEVEVKQIEPRYLAAVRFRTSQVEMASHMGEAFEAVVKYLSGIGVPPDGPAVARFDQPQNGMFDAAVGFYVDSPIDGDGHVVPVELRAGEVACTTHMGPYTDLPRAYEAIATRAKEEGREPATVMWEEYYSPPETQPEETRTDVYWPLKPS